MTNGRISARDKRSLPNGSLIRRLCLSQTCSCNQRSKIKDQFPLKPSGVSDTISSSRAFPSAWVICKNQRLNKTLDDRSHPLFLFILRIFLSGTDNVLLGASCRSSWRSNDENWRKTLHSTRSHHTDLKYWSSSYSWDNLFLLSNVYLIGADIDDVLGHFHRITRRCRIIHHFHRENHLRDSYCTLPSISTVYLSTFLERFDDHESAHRFCIHCLVIDSSRMSSSTDIFLPSSSLDDIPWSQMGTCHRSGLHCSYRNPLPRVVSQTEPDRSQCDARHTRSSQDYLQITTVFPVTVSIAYRIPFERTTSEDFLLFRLSTSLGQLWNH